MIFLWRWSLTSCLIFLVFTACVITHGLTETYVESTKFTVAIWCALAGLILTTYQTLMSELREDERNRYMADGYAAGLSKACDIAKEAFDRARWEEAVQAAREERRADQNTDKS